MTEHSRQRPRPVPCHGGRHGRGLGQDRRGGGGLQQGSAEPRSDPSEAARRRLRRLRRRPAGAFAAIGEPGPSRRHGRGICRLRAAARHRRHAGLFQPCRAGGDHSQALRLGGELLDAASITASFRAIISSTIWAWTATCANSSAAIRASRRRRCSAPATTRTPSIRITTPCRWRPSCRWCSRVMARPKRSIYLRDDQTLAAE